MDERNNDEDPEETDLYFACTDRGNFELRRVSERERELAFDDVWGRPRNGQEPPTDEGSTLQDMQKSVSQCRIKVAFNKVLFLNPAYAFDRQLLRLFYRCSPNSAKKAAQLYCQHFAYKLHYFGLEHVAKPLSINSLQPKDKACLYSGSMQLFRDNCGRIVLCLLPGLLPGIIQRNKDHLIRALWWLLLRAIVEENNIGVVIMIVGDDKSDTLAKALFSSPSSLSRALPMKILAIHSINDDPQGASAAMISRLENSIDRQLRLRLRYHECEWKKKEDGDGDGDSHPLKRLQDKLEKFGLSYIPLNHDGSLVMNNPIDASSKRYFFKQVEAQKETDVIIPNPKDVLLGRGRPYQEFPGNIALANELDAQREAYKGKKDRRAAKTNISTQIVKHITANGGRFLQKVNDRWVVVPDIKAREKIAHGFRMPRTKRPREEEEGQTASLETA